MIGSPSFYFYLPLGVLYMMLIVAFWEEFFFRGVLLRSLEVCTGKTVIAVFLSELCRHLSLSHEVFQSTVAVLP